MFESILQHVSRHVTLDKNEEEQFLSKLKVKRLLKKQFLVQSGNICQTENFVDTGCLRAFYVDLDGYEHIIQFAIEDWWISDLKSFLSQSPATLEVEALENCVLFQLDLKSLEELYSEIPKFERYFRIIIQNAFIALQQRHLSNLSSAAQDRYAEFIRRYPKIEQRVPQYMIASYLGITPEFLSKLRKESTTRKS